MPDEDQVNPLELVKAREEILRQIEILEAPARKVDLNPQLIAKLRAMLDEIDECLGSARSDQS